MPKRNVTAALFDVRPKYSSGSFEVAKTVDLKPKKIIANTVKIEEKRAPVPVFESALSATEMIKNQMPVASGKDIIAMEVESALEEDHLVADLVSAGAVIHAPEPQQIEQESPVKLEPQIEEVQEVEQPIEFPQPRLTPSSPVLTPNLILSEENQKKINNFWSSPQNATLASVTNELSPAAQHVENWLSEMKTRRKLVEKKSFFGSFSKRGIIFTSIIVFFGVAIAIASVSSKDIIVKTEASVIGASSNAVDNLVAAKSEFMEFKFINAADHFAMAYDDFNSASGTLNKFGASFLSVFGDIPGLEKVRSANNIVKAGQYIAVSGQELSNAFTNLFSVNYFAMLPISGVRQDARSFADPIKKFRDSLYLAEENISKSGNLLSKVDLNSIPEDKKEIFMNFRDQLPMFHSYINQAVEYSDFLLGFVGKGTSRKYIVLLQNNSEKRPTGGFPGSYAIISFENGVFKKIFVDDIYNPDGQIKANIVPPSQLQHITPNWGMRDANWFADFPTSAKKIEEFYKLDGGDDLDGVFAITPTVITRLLSVTGPIEMPEYDKTLNAENFLASIQDEVESKKNKIQPKKILIDFQPKFFQKLAESDKEQWTEIVRIILESMREKHLLAYFNDKKLQKQVVENSFAGELRNNGADYVQVTFSNVKGGKADAVTANSFRLFANIGDGEISHTLSIARSHNGGDSKYSFYNMENSSYVKVYLPDDADFVSAEGFSKPKYEALISYSDFGFKSDPLLSAIESTVTHPIEGIDYFEESGKKVIGFWMITKPKKVSTATIVYTTRNNTQKLNGKTYELLWQKQSGSENDQMHVSVNLPEKRAVLNTTKGLQIIGNAAVIDTDLSVDREIKIDFN